MKTLPNSVIGLIEELEELYPARCMKTDESLEDHLRYAGKVDVVERLRERYEVGIKADKKSLPKVL